MKRGNETMLKVPEIAELLDVLSSTVRLWCRSGRFPNAVQEETLRGPVWLIPESDLNGFKKRGRGRPPKPPAGAEKAATGGASASNGPSPRAQKRAAKKRGKK